MKLLSEVATARLKYLNKTRYLSGKANISERDAAGRCTGAGCSERFVALRMMMK